MPDGTEPMYAHTPGGKPSNANQTFLDESGFSFVQDCIQGLENRGLEDQGMYRVVGVGSKVTKLLTMGLDRRKADRINLDDVIEWETKTITSAVKTFFRNLPEPIMTFSLHARFIEAAKCDSYSRRLAQVNDGNINLGVIIFGVIKFGVVHISVVHISVVHISVVHISVTHFAVIHCDVIHFNVIHYGVIHFFSSSTPLSFTSISSTAVSKCF